MGLTLTKAPPKKLYVIKLNRSNVDLNDEKGLALARKYLLFRVHFGRVLDHLKYWIKMKFCAEMY
jgi:hypothetical protein